MVDSTKIDLVVAQKSEQSLSGVRTIRVPAFTSDGHKFEDVGILVKVIRAVLISRYLDDSKPLSLLTVADAGSGKSEVQTRFRDVPGVTYFSPGSTGAGILKALIRLQDRRQDVDFIIMDDLIPTLSRSKHIATAFIGILLNLIDFGMGKPESFDFEELPDVKTPLRVGLICGVTRNYLFKRYGKHVWNPDDKKMQWVGDSKERVRSEFLATGWLERFIPFSFKYSEETINKIIRGLVQKSNCEDYYTVYTSNKRYSVSVTEEQVFHINKVSRFVSESAESNGIRYTKDLLGLVKSFALLRTFEAGTQDSEPITITDADMKDLVEVAPYIGFQFLPLVEKTDILLPSSSQVKEAEKNTTVEKWNNDDRLLDKDKGVGVE